MVSLHSFHTTREAFINSAAPWSLVRPTIAANRDNLSLRQALRTTFPIDENHPLHGILVPDQHERFWKLVAEFITTLHFPEHRRRTTYKPFFTAQGGFQIATVDAVPQFRQLPNLWGHTSPISTNTYNILRDCNTASCRSVCLPHGGLHYHLITGPISLCNFECADHATAIPGDVHSLSVDPAEDELNSMGLAPEDWRMATTRQSLASGDHVTIFYHPQNTDDTDSCSDNSIDGSCATCLVAPPTISLPQPTPSPVPRPKLTVTTKPKPVKSKHTTQVESPLGTSGHLLPHRNKSTRFSVGTYNAQSKLTPDRTQPLLNQLLRTMVTLDLSILAVPETNSTPSSAWCSSKGVSEHGLAAADESGYFKYMGLWAPTPTHRKSSGVTLLWDARIPHEHPFRDPNGRLAAITLLGPHRPTLRVIAIYGVSNPGFAPKEAKSLKSLLDEQIAYARLHHLIVLVLGDLNEHPWSDRKFPRPSYHPHIEDLSLHHSLVGAFNNRQPTTEPKRHPFFDSYRASHPHTDGATLPSKPTKPAHGSRTPGSTRPSRIDQIWFPRAWRNSQHIQSSVDTDKSLLSFSDHRLLVSSIPFKSAFGHTSQEMRRNTSRILTTKYKTAHLSKASFLDHFHRNLTPKITPIQTLLDQAPLARPDDHATVLTDITEQLLWEIQASLVVTSDEPQYPQHTFKALPRKSCPSITPTKHDELLHVACRASALLPALSQLTAPSIMPIWHNFLAAAAAADCSLLSTTTLLPPPKSRLAVASTWRSSSLLCSLWPVI